MVKILFEINCIFNALPSNDANRDVSGNHGDVQ